MSFKRTSIALAVAALAVSPAVFAKGDKGEHGQDGGFSKTYKEAVDVDVRNKTDVSLKKHVDVKKKVDIDADIHFYGEGYVDANAMAVIDDKQMSSHNQTYNTHHNNNASVSDNAMENAQGNIGLNVSAGDNNIQDNAAALSAADASFVFGSADAEIFVNQDAVANATLNSGNVNNASLSGNALSNAAGNIGVNISAGNSNLQKNNLAASVAVSRMSEASVASLQQNGGNSTLNEGRLDVYQDTTQVTLWGGMSGSYAGLAAGGYRGSERGTYSGISDQVGDLYVDNWGAAQSDDPHNSHPTPAPFAGHSDFDRHAQGAVDRNNDGGAFSFNEDGTYSGSEQGSYQGFEVGWQYLAGSFSGTVTTTRLVYTPTANNASLSGNALSSAQGNIGVNIAAGTNNVQSNSLAMAVAMPGAGNGGGE